MGKISDYTRVLAAKLADVFVVDQTDNGTTETKSATVEQIGTAIGTLQNFADLDTSNKNLVDAINEIASYTPVYGNTASGSIATFDTSLALPLQDCTIAINAVQESGTPTPSSPKAISGFTGANIHVADDENPHVIDNVTAISWQSEAGTVYGGSLDVTTGVLTVTHYGKLITDTSEILDASSGTVGFRARVEISASIIPPSDGQTGYDDQKSNVATYVGNAGSIGSNLGTNSFKTHTNGNIYFYLVGYNTLADLKTYAQDMITANTPISFVWKLATPVTYQLTPTQISAIVGTNNIFTDTNGNTSVVYACSLKDYIDSQ